MNPITDIVDSEENGRTKLFTQYRTMLQSMIANRAPEPINESGKSENGAGNDQEENFARRKDEQEDRWIRGKPDDDETSERPYSRTGQIGHGTSKPTSPTQSKSVLSEEDKNLIQRLQTRDREVRQHEQAHSAALGQYAGGIRYTFQVGPDGRSYAIGGSTEVRSSSDSSPEATQARARAIRAAATATSEPSTADRAAAVDAIRMERDAQLRSAKKN